MDDDIFQRMRKARDARFKADPTFSQMHRDEVNAHHRARFDLLLRSANLNKAELSRLLNVTPNTVSKWIKPPGYAVAYLELTIEYNNVVKRKFCNETKLN